MILRSHLLDLCTELCTDLYHSRAHTLRLAATIQPDLIKRQAHSDFSPIGWHLGHIAYIESLQIADYLDGQTVSVPPYYEQLFAADGLPKAEREHLPDLAEILAYMAAVRERSLAAIQSQSLTQSGLSAEQITLLHWLVQHESQHVEIITMVLALHRAAVKLSSLATASARGLTSARGLENDPIHVPAGSFIQGCDQPFALDNERPAHAVWLDAYSIDRHPVTWLQYRQFMRAGGYHTPKWWSAAGWQWKESQNIDRPLYWPEDWPADQPEAQPENCAVCGVSWYEADAYARFVGKRLPSEAEWEKAAGAQNMLGNVWEWTDSWFEGYVGFCPFPYEGYSQAYFDRAHRVLRGGSWATPQWALRSSFRNWYHPHRREMFAGFRCVV